MSSGARGIVAVAAIVAASILLAACGGGGGGGPTGQPGPIDPPAPTDPQPGQRGSSVVPGIDRIPLDRITVPNSRMKDMFTIAENAPSIDGSHIRGVRKVACNSYTLQCNNSESFHGKHRNTDGTVTVTTGSAPYTSITGWTLMENGNRASENAEYSPLPWIFSQLDGMTNLKIASFSMAGFHPIGYSAILPSYLAVNGAGNRSPDGPDPRYPPINPGYGYLDPTWSHPLEEVARAKSAIAANKMLLVAGWDKDNSGNYVRHAWSAECGRAGISEGCVWAQFEFPGVGSGNSFSAPQVASALASVLSVFPDTTHQNLAKFAKACARKTGNGIPALLAAHGGVGVADFTCMGSVTDALASLPTGGRTDVTIQGQSVSVGGRDMTLSFASPAYFVPDFDGGSGAWMALHRADEEGAERGPVSVRFIPTGEGKAMSVGAFTVGDAFASIAVGTRDDFFGFARGHEKGVRETRLTAGHRDAFAWVSDVRSEGGASIRSAEGRSAGLMVQREFGLADGVSVAVSARADRFLGGEAEIGADGVSFGSVHLRPGGWHRQLNVASDIVLDGARTLNLSAELRSPDGGEEEVTLGTRFEWRF